MDALFLEIPWVNVLQVTTKKKPLHSLNIHTPNLQYKHITYVNKANKTATYHSQFAQLVMDMW